jgi:rRNA-processing protein FCF1
MKVLLDTNILMLPGQLRLDALQQVESLCFDFGKPDLLVLSNTIAELTSESKGASKHAAAARIALTIVKTRKLHVVKGAADKADDAVLDWVRQEIVRGNQAVVATNDTDLRKKSRALGARTICLKGKTALGWA